MKIPGKSKWLVIVLLLGALGGSANFVKSLSRDRVDVARIEALGGRVFSVSTLPRWLPSWAVFARPYLRERRVVGVSFFASTLGRQRLLQALETLRGAEQLEGLFLGNNGLRDGDLQILRRFPALTGLGLAHSEVHDEELVHLRNCPRLQTLVLSNTFVTDAGLPHLCGLGDLRSLHLDHTRVTDAGVKGLACLGVLRELSVSATDVSEDGLRALQQHLPELSVSDD